MTYQTIYPYTNEVLATFDNATEQDLEAALAKGHALYKKMAPKGFAHTT